MAQYLPGGAHEDTDVQFLLLPDHSAGISNSAGNQLVLANGLAEFTQALGKALIYDQSLSVNKNLACATCHAP